MITKIVSYKDVRMGYFYAPMVVANDDNEAMIESVRRMVGNGLIPKTFMECDLYCLGTFDDKLGKLSPIDPEFIVRLSDFAHLVPTEVEVKQDVAAS